MNDYLTMPWAELPEQAKRLYRTEAGAALHAVGAFAQPSAAPLDPAVPLRDGC